MTEFNPTHILNVDIDGGIVRSPHVDYTTCGIAHVSSIPAEHLRPIAPATPPVETPAEPEPITTLGALLDLINGRLPENMRVDVTEASDGDETVLSLDLNGFTIDAEGDFVPSVKTGTFRVEFTGRYETTQYIDLSNYMCNSDWVSIIEENVDLDTIEDIDPDMGWTEVEVEVEAVLGCVIDVEGVEYDPATGQPTEAGEATIADALDDYNPERYYDGTLSGVQVISQRLT